jgi:methylase of polypeptide subunit release factors
MLEIGEGQSSAVQALLVQNGFEHIQALQDTGGTERIIVGQLP